jgi:hypothetical protein
MAIARGAGTEIIRSVLVEGLDSSGQTLIVGVQHHIYTVLSVTVFANAVATAGNYVQLRIDGWDAYGNIATQTGSQHKIFRQDMNAMETFVWNDKFSFNGYEPTGISGALNTEAEQDAIADQGGSAVQSLIILTEAGTDDMDITCTYIDQNNA